MRKPESARRDAYGFSRRGLPVIASFAPVPVIGDDRINRAWSERFERRCRQHRQRLHASRNGGCPEPA